MRRIARKFAPLFSPTVFLFLILCYGMAFPQKSGDVPVTMESSESLRSLAKEYLGESNDWEIILYYNGLKSSEALKTGQRLWIPVQKYKEVAKGISYCQTMVVAANAEGAGVLVPLKIEQAIENLNKAMQQKKEGDLQSAGNTIEQAIVQAKQALDETKGKRLQSVTAVLAEKRGTVQYRPNDVIQWKDAVLKQELIDKDRLRTLSRAYGNILFIDGSRVQMDENALIVIEAINKDVLRNMSSVDILVLDGDVSTLINSLQTNNNFRVKSPGVNTSIRSRNFLTSRDQEKTTRFSNFEGEMDVISRGKQVTLIRNEGTKVGYGKVPADPKKLLQPPLPVYPSDEQSLLDNTIAFRWDPVQQASQYHIQISRNKAFTEIEKSMKIPQGQPAVWEASQNGGYFWRICAIDKDLMQGPYSKSIGFTVQVDRIPPFLIVASPARDTVVFSSNIEIRGKTEKGVLITVNRDTAGVSPEGDFHHTTELNEGKQYVTVTAVDRAGNKSQIQRGVVSNSGQELFSLSVDEPLRSNTRRVTVNGRIKPQVRLEMDGQPIEPHDESFTRDLVLDEGLHEIRIKATSPEGRTQEKNLKILVDTEPPDMQIREMPSFTERSSIRLEGSLSEPAEVFVNARSVPLVDSSFSIPIDLKEGANPISVRMKDTAGNIAEKSYTVVLDTKPPQVLSYTLTPSRVVGGEMAVLSVRAIDKGVGIARTCTFIIETVPGGVQWSGLLKLNPESGNYEGSLNVSPGNPGTLKWIKLYVSDYLGNTAVLP